MLSRIFDRDLDPVTGRELAREIYPDNPLELESVLYDIGKEYCLPELCYCEDCPVGKEDECQDYRKYKAKVSADKQERSDSILDDKDKKFWDHVKELEGKTVYTLVRSKPLTVAKVDENWVTISGRDSRISFFGKWGLYENYRILYSDRRVKPGDNSSAYSATMAIILAAVPDEAAKGDNGEIILCEK